MQKGDRVRVKIALPTTSTTGRIDPRHRPEVNLYIGATGLVVKDSGPGEVVLVGFERQPQRAYQFLEEELEIISAQKPNTED